jgi:malate dehydrogenase (oxaloacetate-decarboxylating)(NADP+)
MLLHKGDVDGMICGTWGTTATHLHYIDQVIGKRGRQPQASGCAPTPA